MRASVGNGGWVALDDLGLPGPLYVRLGAIDGSGRLRVTEFYLDSSGNRETSINESDLRELPLAAVETVLNNELADAVRKRLGLPGPDLSTLASYFSTSFGTYERQIEERNWVVISFAAQFDANLRRAAGLPRIAHARRKDRKVFVRNVDKDFRLTTGPEHGLTEEFLREVARAYAAALLRRERPNVSICDQLGGLYPLKTVQRWVYTARQRGIMAAGSRGRAG